MAKIPLTPALRAEYGKLFETCVAKAERQTQIDALAAKLIANRSRYEAVGKRLGIPWAFIAVTHNMESTQNFSKHLHNGDPLTARTRQVPAGRPKTGSPPFTWEESAADALTMKGLGSGTDWSLAGMLYQLEAYNGWGYRRFHPHVLTPYLWSFSNHYRRGKYVADGTWSDTAVSAQCGAAVILRRMAEKKAFSFSDQPEPKDKADLLVVAFSNSARSEAALKLQTWLNSHAGIFVKLDGVPGRNTSDAFRAVTGRFLPGDPQG